MPQGCPLGNSDAALDRLPGAGDRAINGEEPVSRPVPGIHHRAQLLNQHVLWELPS